MFVVFSSFIRRLYNKMKTNNNIVTLKISNGHKIWIFKELINGYKYIGIYDKNIQLNTERGGKI